MNIDFGMMRFSRPSDRNKTLFPMIITVLLTACGPSESLTEEAYDAGWRSVWNERCRGIKPPLMMPSKYDDSTGSGKLVSHFRAGIADAEADKNLCE